MNNLPSACDSDAGKGVYHLLAENTTAAIFLLAGQKIYYANPAAQSLTGYSAQVLLNMPFEQLAIPEDREALNRLVAEVQHASRALQSTVVRCQLPGGPQRWLLVSARPVLLAGLPGCLLTAYDLAWIVEHTPDLEHQAQDIAREAGRRAEELEVVFNAMVEAVLVYDTQGNLLRANPAAQRVHGFDPKGLSQQSVVDQITLRYPPDREGGKRVPYADLPAARAFKGEAVYGERLVLTDAEGQERTIIDSASPLYDSQGNLYGAVVVWRDVTDRERLLSQLGVEHARLLAVIDFAPEAIVITDAAGRTLLANPLAGQLLGEMVPLGMDFSSLGHLQFFYPDGTPYDPRHLPLVRSALDGEAHQDVEMFVLLPNGERRWLLVNTGPVLDDKGNVNGALAIFQEITARKQSEKEILARAQRSEVQAALSQALSVVGLDYTAVLDAIVRQLAELVGDACLIRLISADGKTLELAAIYTAQGDDLASIREALAAHPDPVDDSPVGSVFKSGKSLLVPFVLPQDLKALVNTHYRPWLTDHPPYSVLIVPLRAHGIIIGTLTMARFHLHDPYSVEDQHFFEDLAERAALAIENARLFQAQAQRTCELDALQTATAALLTTLDLDSLLGYIMNAAISAIPAAEKGTLHLVDPHSGQLQMRASHGYHPSRPKKRSATIEESHAAGAVRERRPLLISDLRSGPSARHALPGSMIAAPLILGDQVLGVLSLEASHLSAFNEADLRLLVSFAATTTTAIHNATLHSQVQMEAITDSLTGLYNRRGFFEIGRREVERRIRFKRPLAAILLDIDAFKLVNDRYSHAIGDQVLAALAQRLHSGLRDLDILGRYGGDEFAILLPETDLATACAIAERLRQRVIDPPVETNAGHLSITISLGVTRASAKTPDLETLLSRADVALHQAKHLGCNRVEVI